MGDWLQDTSSVWHRTPTVEELLGISPYGLQPDKVSVSIPKVEKKVVSVETDLFAPPVSIQTDILQPSTELTHLTLLATNERQDAVTALRKELQPVVEYSQHFQNKMQITLEKRAKFDRANETCKNTLEELTLAVGPTAADEIEANYNLVPAQRLRQYFLTALNSSFLGTNSSAASGVSTAAAVALNPSAAPVAAVGAPLAAKSTTAPVAAAPAPSPYILPAPSPAPSPYILPETASFAYNGAAAAAAAFAGSGTTAALTATTGSTGAAAAGAGLGAATNVTGAAAAGAGLGPMAAFTAASNVTGAAGLTAAAVGSAPAAGLAAASIGWFAAAFTAGLITREVYIKIQEAFTASSEKRIPNKTLEKTLHEQFIDTLVKLFPKELTPHERKTVVAHYAAMFRKERAQEELSQSTVQLLQAGDQVVQNAKDNPLTGNGNGKKSKRTQAESEKSIAIAKNVAEKVLHLDAEVQNLKHNSSEEQVAEVGRAQYQTRQAAKAATADKTNGKADTEKIVTIAPPPPPLPGIQPPALSNSQVSDSKQEPNVINIAELLKIYKSTSVSAETYLPFKELPVVVTAGDVDIYSLLYSQRLSSTTWMPSAMWTAPCCNEKLFVACTAGSCIHEFPLLVPQDPSSNRNLCTRGHFIPQRISLRLRLQHALQNQAQMWHAQLWWDKTIAVETKNAMSRICKKTEDCLASYISANVSCVKPDQSQHGTCTVLNDEFDARAKPLNIQTDEDLRKLWKEVQPKDFDKYQKEKAPFDWNKLKTTDKDTKKPKPPN